MYNIKKAVRVAQFLYKHSPEDLKERMYVIGLLHNIGYLRGKTEEVYGLSSLMLDDLKMSSREIIYTLGKPKEITTEEEVLLNWAVIHFDDDGNYIGFDEYLRNVELKYGKDSEEYKNSTEMIELLSGKGFK